MPGALKTLGNNAIPITALHVDGAVGGARALVAMM